jgi:hypothetical protein
VLAGHTVLCTSAGQMLSELAGADGDNALRHRLLWVHQFGGHEARVAGALLQVLQALEQGLAAGVLPVEAGTDAAAEGKKLFAAQLGAQACIPGEDHS